MSTHENSSKKPSLSLENDNDNGNVTALDLLPELWATKILGFLSMGDILSCSIVDKGFFLEQVSPLVELLVVTNSANLRVAPHALQEKRFKGVNKIWIYCLFQDYENCDMCAETCQHLVQFLACFPMLRNVELCGGTRELRGMPGRSYIAYYEPTVRKKKNCEILGNLLHQLCNAFSTGQLDSQVHIRGLRYMCGSVEKRRDCRCCRTMCYSFPTEQVILPFFGAPCLDIKDRLEIALDRDIDVDDMERTSQLDTMLSDALREKYLGRPTKIGDDYAFVTAFFPKQSIVYMDWLIQKGANPRQPQLRKILTTWRKVPSGEVAFGFVDDDPTAPRRLCSQTFQDLKRLGMDLSEKDFELIDNCR